MIRSFEPIHILDLFFYKVCNKVHASALNFQCVSEYYGTGGERQQERNRQSLTSQSFLMFDIRKGLQVQEFR